MINKADILTDQTGTTSGASVARDRKVRLPGMVRVFCVLFFFSGFPALLYQLIWQRALFRILGVNIESVTIVVTAFMLGLGLGSLFGGWLTQKRHASVLLILAAIELLTGLFGFYSLQIFAAVGDQVVGSPLPMVALVTLALVILPTLLMGATLPLLVGHLTRRIGGIGESLGLLYYVNTLGASTACVVGMILLFPYLGMQGSVLVAAATNGLVGIGALVAYAVEQRSKSPETQAQAIDCNPVAPASVLPFKWVLMMSAASGFVALSYEIFFFRTVSYASGSSAGAFAATLGIFLLGLAVGGREGGEASRQHDTRGLLRRIARALLIAAIASAAFLPVLNYTAWLGRGSVAVALVLVFVISRNWGLLLPCLAQLGISADAQAGMRTAQLYLCNIVGAASGSILTGFVLMEHFGLVSIAQLLVAASLVCALALAVLARRPSEDMSRLAGLIVAGIAVVALIVPGSRGVLEALQWKGASEGGPVFTDVVQNRSGIITVDDTGVVYGGGAYDGSFNIDPFESANGIIRPYALSLFHASPKEVLMIGLASGSWAQVIANNPAVERLTVVEINPGYSALIAARPEIASVLDNPKVNYVYDDGRRWLRTNPERLFDAIVTNTTFHYRANATNLLSSDYLKIVKQHLKPGGIAFYNTTDSARVQRTACSEFPYGARFTNHTIVSDSPLKWDFVRWKAVLESYQIDNKSVFKTLSETGEKLIVEWMGIASHIEDVATNRDEDLIETCEEILTRTDELELVTDDNMGTEWSHKR